MPAEFCAQEYCPGCLSPRRDVVLLLPRQCGEVHECGNSWHRDESFPADVVSPSKHERSPAGDGGSAPETKGGGAEERTSADFFEFAEPWRFRRSEVTFARVTDSRGNVICAEALYGGSTEDREFAGLRRMVACVNYCAGMPTETLEARSFATVTGKG